MTSKAPEAGRMERLVKMDYSGTYRENDKLDVDLDDRLINLTRSAQRLLSERDEELETARADADKILKLKEAVKNRPEGEQTLAILCHSAKVWRRQSSVASSGQKRRMSAATSVGGRRSSRLSSGRDSVQEADWEDDDVLESASRPSSQLPDMKTMSLTERRLAKEREQFSAKNLFNIRRSNTAYILDSKRREVSPDTPRTPTPIFPNQPSSPTRQNSTPNRQLSSPSPRKDRPKTSPAAYGGRSAPRQRGYMRPTTASVSRLVTFNEPLQDDGFHKPRRPRSRRELKKLVELKIDPFEEEVVDQEESWTSNGDRQQDLLHSLRVDQAQLQARVAAFLTTMEHFNKKGRKSTLEQILEGT